MKVSPELEQMLKRDPMADMAVIVHVQDGPTRHTGDIERLGLSVVRAFRLTNTLAVRGPAAKVRELAQEPWVTRVEVDQTIVTMD
jgi:hypothetical protein